MSSGISLPPGPTYVVKNLRNIMVPPLITIAVVKATQRYPDFSINVPTYGLVIAMFFSFPLSLFLKTWIQDWKHEREARRHGAVLPPIVKSKWPAGLDLFLNGIKRAPTEYTGDTYEELAKTYGYTFNFKFLFENRFFTAEPEHIKAMLASQFDNYEKGLLYHDMHKSVLGSGLFNSDGEMWKFHRTLTRPFFSKDRVTSFEIFDRHALDALSQLKSRLRQGFPVDFQDLIARFTLDSATEFLFNQNVKSLAAGLPYPYYSEKSRDEAALKALEHPSNKFARAFADCTTLICMRGKRGANWPLAEFWKDAVSDKMEIVNAFTDPIVKSAIQKKRELDKGRGEKKSVFDSDREVKEGESLLDHLIHYTEDEVLLRDEILNILLAGRDTTANTLTFAVYMLSQHHDILQKLGDEILNTVGESRRPTIEDMKEMKYLRAVINETLRLYPAVPVNIKSTTRPVILPGKNGAPPYYIPAGSKSPYSVIMLHRRKDLWGPDALEFDPERFLDERHKKYFSKNPFIFVPFNAGPRICLGQQFAYHEVSFFLIRLLQQFSSIAHDLEAQPPEHRPPAAWKGADGPKGRDRIRMKTTLTMSAEGGCWVRMEEAYQGDD